MVFLSIRLKYYSNLILNFILTFLIIIIFTSIFTINEVFSEEGKKNIEISFYNLNIGNFIFNYKIYESEYVVNTSGKIRNFIFFSNLNIASGSIGRITENGSLSPAQSSVNWNFNQKKFFKRKIIFKNNKVIDFITSGQPKFLKTNFSPIGQKNSIDPSTALLFFLRNKNKNEICKGQLSVIDGHRLVDITFADKKITNHNEIICEGVIKRSKGFRKNLFFKKTTIFLIFYKKNKNNKFVIQNLSFRTLIGLIDVKILD